MRVAGGNDRLAELFAQRDDPAVEIAQPLVVRDLALGDQEAVVADRLDLEVIVERGDALDLVLRLPVQHGAEQLARLARRADDEAVAVLLQHGLRDAGIAAVILQIAHRDETIQVLQPDEVFDQDNLMVGAQIQRVGARLHDLVDAPEVGNALVHQLLGHLEVDHRQHLRVVAGAVMVEVAEAVMLGEDVQLVLLEVGVGKAGERDRVEIGIGERDLQLLGGGADETRIEVGIVRDQHPVARKFEKSGDGFINRRRVGHHLVGDAGQLGDLFRDGHPGVDKGVEAVQHLALADAHRADLGDAAV